MGIECFVLKPFWTVNCVKRKRWSQKGNHLGHFRGVGRYNSHKRSNTLRFVFLRRGFLPESRLVGSKEGLFQLVGNSCLFKINLTQKHRFELIFKNLEIPAAFTLGHLLRQHNQKFKIHTAQLRLPKSICSVSKSSKFLLPNCCHYTGEEKMYEHK